MTTFFALMLCIWLAGVLALLLIGMCIDDDVFSEDYFVMSLLWPIVLLSELYYWFKHNW